jgi:hypothetical protein
LFYQDNCQEFLVQQVNPQIWQDNKSLLKHTKKQGAAEHREYCCTAMRVKTDLLM